jgi:hypothetical protein
MEMLPAPDLDRPEDRVGPDAPVHFGSVIERIVQQTHR